MLIILDYQGTLVGNAQFSAEDCASFLLAANCCGHKLIIWTGYPDRVEATFRGLVDEISDKPGIPAAVEERGGWGPGMLLVDDDELMLKAVSHAGVATLRASEIDQLMMAAREAA